MPALPDVTNVLRIDNMFHIGEDLKAKTRQFWRYLSGPPTSGELNTMAAAVGVAFASNLASLMSSSYHLAEVIITDLTSPTAAVGSNATSHAGTRSGTNLDAAACVLESDHVSRRYRGGHPRIYWPFGAAPDINDEQTWGTTFVGNVFTGLSNYGLDIAAAIDVWGTSDGRVNVSYYNGFTVHTGVTGRARNVSTPRTTPLVDPIVSYSVPVGIANQRRRLLRLA